VLVAFLGIDPRKLLRKGRVLGALPLVTAGSPFLGNISGILNIPALIEDKQIQQEMITIFCVVITHYST
jgi:hypothetical protein